jgi:ABC-type transport system involved in multi-copper enzyme maturation permease subunit
VTQFFAILKDSFREAVDGFVIYLMLGMSALLIIAVASISYTPDAPGDGLERAMQQQFNIIYPDRGASKLPTSVRDPKHFRAINYRVSEGTKNADGSVSFKLRIDPSVGTMTTTSVDETGKNTTVTKPSVEPDAIDLFRYAVYTWKSSPGPKLSDVAPEERRTGRNRGPEITPVLPPRPDPDSLRAVTDDEMVAFLKNQCVLYLDVKESDVTIRRVPDPMGEPYYAFEVGIKSVSGARGWPHGVQLLFGAVPPITGVPLGSATKFIQDQIVNGIGALVALCLSVVITAFFIPNMMRKGSIDLLVSKPIGRVQLLVYKYVGGLTFIFLVSAFTIGGVWLVMAARSGMWDPSFLLVIFALTFTFAILYAVSTVVAVYTRSAIASILVTFGFMFVMWLIGLTKTFFDANKVVQEVNLPEWSYTLVDTLNNCLPRYKDLDKLTTKLITDTNQPEGLARLQGVLIEYPSWGGAIGVSLAFIAVMLALASWRFVKRDY